MIDGLFDIFFGAGFLARFGDRVVPAFCERPRSIPAMVAEAVARNGDGEALVCGATRLTWREVARQTAQIAAGFQKLGHPVPESYLSRELKSGSPDTTST